MVYSCYQNKKGEFVEGGNYRMNGTWTNKIVRGVIEKKSSFWLSEDVSKNMNNDFIQKFRSEFRLHADEIELFLKNQTSVVIHFNFEGKRWFDLMRMARRDGKTDRLIKLVIRKSEENSSVLSSKLKDMNALYWPISESELKANPRLKQNPFYETDLLK